MAPNLPLFGYPVMIRPDAIPTGSSDRVEADMPALPPEQEVRQRLAALEASPDGVAVFDDDLSLRYANSTFCRTYACADFDAMARLAAGAEEGWIGLFDPTAVHSVKDEVLPLVMRSGSWKGRLPARRRDGSPFTADLSIARMPEGGLVVVLRDVTEAAESEADLRERQEMYCLLATNSTDVISLHDVDGSIVYVSPSSLRLMGCAPKQLIGNYPWRSIHPDDVDRARGVFERALEGGTGSVSYRLKVKSGIWVWFETLVRPVSLEDDDEIRQVQCSTRDVTAQKELEQQLAHQALHDPLTGLPNRSLFMDRLSQAPLRARRAKMAYGVVYLDLDRFKQVNDELGHAAGDQLLVQVAERLTAQMRESDTLARLSGDEFAIILENLEDSELASQLGARLLAIFDEPFVVEGTVVAVRPSVGIAIDEAGESEAGDLLRSADLAMYAAKRDPDRGFVERIGMGNGRAGKLQKSLERAIENNELRLHYQPLVSSTEGRPVALEAFLRWRPQDVGFMSPPEILAIARQGDLLDALTRWIVRKALEDSRSWRTDGFETLRVCLNLSEEELANPSLVEVIRAALDEASIEPSLLQFELNARSLRGHAERLRALRALGSLVALDGFGTDPVSLPQLGRAPVDALKIARSLVDDMPERQDGSKDTGVVEAILGIGHRLGLSVTAEGVETRAQAQRLRELGCDTIQGFYVGRPVPPLRVPGYLNSFGTVVASGVTI